MVIYEVKKGTPYKLVTLSAHKDYSHVVNISPRTTKHTNTFLVDDIVIDPILFANNPQEFAYYDQQLIELALCGYIVVGGEDTKNYLMAVKYTEAEGWG